ncbi:MAG TPA: hypothetical protein VFA20_31140 [Myxococcaceae bacterium]|nr:hypothetical protein [Myxococcaceae bacterium]
MRRFLSTVLACAALGGGCTPALLSRAPRDTDPVWNIPQPAAACRVDLVMGSIQIVRLYDRDGRILLATRALAPPFQEKAYETFEWKGDQLVAMSFYDEQFRPRRARATKHFRLHWRDGHPVQVEKLESFYESAGETAEWKMKSRSEETTDVTWEGRQLVEIRSTRANATPVRLAYRDGQLVQVGDHRIEWKDGRIVAARWPGGSETLAYTPEGWPWTSELREERAPNQAPRRVWWYYPDGALKETVDQRRSYEDVHYEYDDRRRLISGGSPYPTHPGHWYTGDCPAGLEAPPRPDPVELVGGRFCFESPERSFKRCW